MKIGVTEYRALLRHDLAYFIERSFAEVNPGTDFAPNWHIEVMAHELERCRTGETKRLIKGVCFWEADKLVFASKSTPAPAWEPWC